MNNKNRTYLCIDLKSFYASVECVERNLDPLVTNLVVADPDRTQKTICLAITPPMKQYGLSSRCRVFEIPAGVDYIMAPPRMKLYITYSAHIYSIYLKYISKEDIHVYSIDEAFMDVTEYLSMYQMTAKELGIQIMKDIYETCGVTATCGIGTNLYLAKIALDITAKHVKDHIGILDEEQYCATLWDHEPLKDFWRIGSGIQKRLNKIGISTMRDIAEAEEEVLYRLLGVDAELLIDHAWGRETTRIADIKSYQPKNNSISSGQVLMRNYDAQEALLVLKEMADALCLDLVDKGQVTNGIGIMAGYANELDLKFDHGSITLPVTTNAIRVIMPHVIRLFEKTIKQDVPIRRLGISFHNLVDEAYEQYDLFSDPKELERDRKLQKAALEIKKRFGSNALVRGMDLQEAATGMDRNRQIGGHRSGDDKKEND
ncbi:MAG: DNA repair protein [Lachnospiraceae bacterium]